MSSDTDRPVALITMATAYVGPHLTRIMAERGFDLVMHTPENAAATFGVESTTSEQIPELEKLGAAVEVVTGVDLTTRDGNAELVSRALSRFGRIDSACCVTGEIVVGPFMNMTIDQWERVKTANLDMVFHGLQALIAPMVVAGSGQIVMFTSATGGRPDPMVSIYGATRAGANGLVRAVGLEHAGDGVQINAIGTNYMDFPGFLRATGADKNPDRRASIEAQVPLRRLGTMEELAAFTSGLLDGSNRFQTAQFFDFSGGWGA